VSCQAARESFHGSVAGIQPWWGAGAADGGRTLNLKIGVGGLGKKKRTGFASRAPAQRSSVTNEDFFITAPILGVERFGLHSSSLEEALFCGDF